MPQRGKWELGSWPCLYVFIVKLDGWVKIGAISLYEFRAQWEEWLQHGCATLIGTSFIWKITTISQKEEGEIPAKSLKGQKLNIDFTFHLLTRAFEWRNLRDMPTTFGQSIFSAICKCVQWKGEATHLQIAKTNTLPKSGGHISLNLFFQKPYCSRLN